MSYQQQIKEPVMLPGCGPCPAACKKDGQIHQKMKVKMNNDDFNMEEFLTQHDIEHECTDHCGDDWMTEAMKWN